jgi:peptide/nickel transport system permease protein
MIKSILSFITMLLLITMVSFGIMRLAPGDPTQQFLSPKMGAEDMVQIRKNYGLDDPLPVQYIKWLKNVMQGNLGYSYSTGKPVFTAIVERLPATLILSITSLICILLIACPLGLYSGANPNKPLDYIVTLLSLITMAMPAFWIGLMLILLFSLKFDLFPTSGYLDPLMSGEPMWRQWLDIAHHLVLPLATTVIGGVAGLIRFNRFNVITIIAQDYIKAARARGVGAGRILLKHAFKNASLPIVTILGLSLPDLIGGSLVIEYIFSWPGMGQLGIAAVFQRDYPILMGTVLITSILILMGNRLADMAYRWVDPRIQS